MSNIEQRLSFISQRIQQIKNSGEIAAPNTWIQKFYVPKNGKRYEYYRLMKACSRKSKTGKIQGQIERYLGKLGSKLYKKFTAAIDRRNQLQKLEKIYQKLLVLLESELVSGGIVSESANEGENRKRPKLTNSKSDNQDTTNRIADLARAIALLQKNQEQLWKWLVKVVEKVGIAIGEHERLSGATLASSK
ncbi:MAG: hypothetical protein QNJ54_33195 [Prochloraceae cyanobacterium]|nr:hypothetical protein [Prochloraceae cyanobacterium]